MSPPGLRILELVRDPSRRSTAAVARLAAPLRTRGVDTIAMLAHGGALAPLTAAGIDAHVVPFGDEPSWMAVNATTALIDTAAIDVLRAWPGSHALGALAAALTGRRCLAVPALPTLNMRELEAQRLVPAMHLAMPHDAAAFAAGACGLEADRIHVVPPCVVPVDAPVSRTELARRLGLPDDARFVAFAGMLTHDEAPWLLVRAAVPALQRDASLHVLLLGDGPLRQPLLRQAQRSGMEGRVHCFDPGDTRAASLGAAEILVLPGARLADLDAALEAMQAGVPVVAAAGGPLAPTLVPECTGRLVDPDRPDLLADALRDLLDDGATRARLRASARDAAASVHGVEAAAQRLAALFARLAASRRPERSARAQRVNS